MLRNPDSRAGSSGERLSSFSSLLSPPDMCLVMGFHTRKYRISWKYVKKNVLSNRLAGSNIRILRTYCQYKYTYTLVYAVSLLSPSNNPAGDAERRLSPQLKRGEIDRGYRRQERHNTTTNRRQERSSSLKNTTKYTSADMLACKPRPIRCISHTTDGMTILYLIRSIATVADSVFFSVRVRIGAGATSF